MIENMAKIPIVILGFLILVFLAQRPSLIDAGAEPSGQVPDPKPETQTAATTNNVRLNGIDVSHYQGDIDWPVVKSTDVAFAYVKATEGNTWSDPKFSANAQMAEQAGIFVGSYHLFIPHDDPVEQAKHFLSTANVKKGALPPALDIEPIGSGLTVADVQGRVQKWLDHVESSTGCRPIIYSGSGNWKTYLADSFHNYDVWLAQYTKQPNPSPTSPDWIIWQHKSNGRVNGISGTVDLNYYSTKAERIEAILCQ